jgi:hypothetical protein
MRTYHLLASRPGGFMNWPGDTLASKARIGIVVREMFRRWFGHSPDNYVWHKDGYMAGASDRRGNQIDLHQINYSFCTDPFCVALARRQDCAPLQFSPEGLPS